MKNCLSLLLFLVVTNCIAQNSSNINLLFHWEDSTINISTVHGNAYNDVWGYTQNGREYAIIGSTLGAHFFDVTDPSNSTQVDFIPGAVQGPIIIHRDYHDYNGYLYMVADEGPSTLQIVDLSFLPDSVHLVYDSDTLFNVAHNIFIDADNAKLYTCGGANQLAVYSLADPTNPTLLVNCLTQVSIWPSTVGYVHDIYVRNDTAYCNAGTNGLWVVDFSNTTSPQLLGSLSQYIQNGYNHSGWLNQAGDFYAMADETHGMDVKMVGITDLQDMQVVDTFDTGIDALSIPHNLIFKGDYLYVSYYHDGLYIFNTCNPNNVTVAGYYDTSNEPHDYDYKGAWGVYPYLPSGNILVSDMQRGLFVFDVTETLVSIEQTTLNVDCPMSHNGIASVQVQNGTGGYDYSWSLSTFEKDSVVNSLSGGDYSVTITDTNNCTYESSFTVTEPPAFLMTLQLSHVTTPGGNDGFATVSGIGGTPGYEFEWWIDTIPFAGDSVFGLKEGWHSVQITDSLGCQIDTAFLILAPVGIQDSKVGEAIITTYPNPFFNSFQLSLSHYTTGDYFRLIDISGRILANQEITNELTIIELDERYTPGLYLLRTFLSGTWSFHKVIKTH